MFDQKGRDIVCASVTSAVQLCANGITEICKEKANLQVSENEIRLLLENPDCKESALCFVEALYLHLHLLSEDYPGTVQISNVEV